MGSTAVRLPADFVSEATARAEIEFRSTPKQIERWAKIGKAAEENPDLPIDFVIGALEGLEEAERGEVSKFELRAV